MPVRTWTSWKSAGEPVDIAMVAFGSDHKLVPMHGIEAGYEHPFCVSPEFRLCVRSDLQASLIASFRQGTVDFAKLISPSPDAISDLKGKFGHIDVAAFYDIIRSGVALNFRYAGQCAPNRPDVQNTYGGRIFIELTQPALMCKKLRGLIKKHCVPDTAAQLMPLIMPDGHWEHTLGHEFFHPFGRSIKIDDALGDAEELLEEAKGLSRRRTRHASPHGVRIAAFATGRDASRSHPSLHAADGSEQSDVRKLRP